MSFTNELFKLAFLLFKTCLAILNTRSLEALVAMMQRVFLASSLRAGNYKVLSRHHWENAGRHLYHTLSVALNFLLVTLSHKPWVIV